MSARRSRSTRPHGRGILQARDEKVLSTTGRMKAASSPQLSALYFSDPSTASRRLSVLLGLGLIHVLVRNLNLPNVYSLSQKGVAELTRRGVDPDDLHAGRLPRTASLEHLLGLGDIRVALELEVRGVDGLTIDHLYLDHELRRLAGTTGAVHIPDVLVELKNGVGARTLAIELDLAEESVAFFARTKGQTTLALAQAKALLWGLDHWRPLVLAPSLTRLRHLARALHEVGAGDLWWGSTTAQVNETGLLGPSWASARTIAMTPREATPSFTLSPLPRGGASWP